MPIIQSNLDLVKCRCNDALRVRRSAYVCREYRTSTVYIIHHIRIAPARDIGTILHSKTQPTSLTRLRHLQILRDSPCINDTQRPIRPPAPRQDLHFPRREVRSTPGPVSAQTHFIPSDLACDLPAQIPSSSPRTERNNGKHSLCLFTS
jgi:hypothetical protein